jgi:hypothetical protein
MEAKQGKAMLEFSRWVFALKIQNWNTSSFQSSKQLSGNCAFTLAAYYNGKDFDWFGSAQVYKERYLGLRSNFPTQALQSLYPALLFETQHAALRSEIQNLEAAYKCLTPCSKSTPATSTLYPTKQQISS